ncbi:MAG: SDR family oxidoreductase [Parvularculales bacterium]
MTLKQFGSKGWTPEQLGSLIGKTYIITGATAGTGFEAARTLLSKGAKVVMLNRNENKSNATVELFKQEFGSDADISFVQMDLAVMQSVRDAAEEILKNILHIDALICNAGIAQVAKQQMTKDGFESQIGVNHFGHFLLAGLLFETIAKSEGRIVVVASNGYRMGLKKIQFEDINFDRNYNPWKAYSQSKLAQMMFAYELQRRVLIKGQKVQVHVCHPGASRTDLINNHANLATRIAWSLLSRFAQSAEQGAWSQIMCATQDGLKPERYYGPTKAQMVGPVDAGRLEPFALDKDVAAKLWALSEEKTSFRWPD